MARSYSFNFASIGSSSNLRTDISTCSFYLYNFLTMSKVILGISAFYHDSAVALVENNKIILAIQEERFTRIKHDRNFPENALIYCLNFLKSQGKDVDHFVFYEKPFLKFERLLETYLAYAPVGFRSFLSAMPLWIKEKLFQKSQLIKHLRDCGVDNPEKKVFFSDHHLSHAASAFYPSPFNSSAILTMDGVGEWTTTSVSVGIESQITLKQEIKFPHSLGLLYSAFTYFCGFKVNSGEYKLMGLAPYGKPRFADIIRQKIIKIYDDGSFHLNMKYFNYCQGLTMTSSAINDLFEGPPRKPEQDLTSREMDIAASIQNVTEEIVLNLARYIRQSTNMNNLCLAGGVALNCVANGKLEEEKIFDNIWIQPAAGDAGGALGAALAFNYLALGSERKINLEDDMEGSYLGPEYSDLEVESQLKKMNATFTKHEEAELIEIITENLTAGMAIGHMNGRMEYGPRALGNRSIIADPRKSTMQKDLNLKVKFRESFRPFAPAVLEDDASEWFEIKSPSPYMLKVSKLNKDKQILVSEDINSDINEIVNQIRSEVPAVTHIDYSARVQTVREKINPRFHTILKSFKLKTGCPILINTSFNVRGEPIVQNAEDAYKCFMGTNLDVLIINNFICFKDQQSKENLTNYKNKYELD